jgi:hypothetical protein
MWGQMLRGRFWAIFGRQIVLQTPATYYRQKGTIASSQVDQFADESIGLCSNVQG